MQTLGKQSVDGGLNQRALFSVGETGQILSLGRSKVYELIAAGKLDVARIGRATRVTRFSLLRYLVELGALPADSPAS